MTGITPGRGGFARSMTGGHDQDGVTTCPGCGTGSRAPTVAEPVSSPGTRVAMLAPASRKRPAR